MKAEKRLFYVEISNKIDYKTGANYQCKWSNLTVDGFYEIMDSVYIVMYDMNLVKRWMVYDKTFFI